MVALQERVEFGSPAWIAAARQVLAEQAAAVGLPAGCEASVCEAFTDAPGHLGLPRDTASWNARFADGTVTLEAGETDGVDVKTTGDYSAVLPTKMAVYGDEAGKARVWRESDHRLGPDAVVTKGTVPHPAIEAILDRFHDDMALRTVDNPDLAMRLRKQGLQSNIADLDERGYTILERAVSEEFADEIRDGIITATGGNVREQNVLSSQQAARLVTRGRAFEEAALHPWVLSIAEYMCGQLFTLTQSMGVTREHGGAMCIHDDYVMVREPFPEYCLSMTTIWALEEFDRAAGPTVVIPGSHQRGHHVPNNYGTPHTEFDTTPVLMPKGSIALWHAATWHGAADRTAPGTRVSLHNSFSRVFVRGYDHYHDIDRSILDRNPPVLTTICGLDSIFEHNTEQGPYFEGLVLDAIQT